MHRPSNYSSWVESWSPLLSPQYTDNYNLTDPRSFPTAYSYPLRNGVVTATLTAVPGYIRGSDSFSAIDISSVITIDDKYWAGVLAPNGKIYMVPRNADNVGVLDPSSGSFTVIDISSVISGGSKYYGGVLAPNGKIYIVPYNADNVGVLDPSSGSFTVIDISSVISSDWKYGGGVLAPMARYTWCLTMQTMWGAGPILWIVHCDRHQLCDQH